MPLNQTKPNFYFTKYDFGIRYTTNVNVPLNKETKSMYKTYN